MSSSKIYEPALIKFEKTSSGLGFSLNLVIFDSSLKHRAVSPTDAFARYVVNINYVWK